MKLSQRVQTIPNSPTLAIASKAKALLASGVDVISFSAGEPDFATPEPIVAAAREAMGDARLHKYTPVGGTEALKSAIGRYLARRRGVEFSNAEIIVSCGAKHSLYNAFLSILDPGDEVLVPAPAWVSYPTQIEIAGGVPVLVPTEAADDFVPSLAALDAAVTDATRAIVINSPSNPSGGFWSRAALQRLAGWLDRHPQIVVISDAIYDELVYDGEEATELLHIAPQLRDRYLLVNGLSKAFAMTGWRLGYTCGPADVVAAMTRLQSQSTSNPTAIVQHAGIVALDQAETLVPPMRALFERRRDLMVGLLSAIDGVSVNTPRGAFYVFPDFRAFIGRRAGDLVLEDDMVLASWLLDAAKVAVVPGTPFGAPGFARLSYATSDALIEAGVARIAAALSTVD